MDRGTVFVLIYANLVGLNNHPGNKHPPPLGELLELAELATDLIWKRLKEAPCQLG